jgi:hypothetical protein|tara:strand:+ start:311 stop:604 length:294 start_codon:yes stop_codon:yes gene_type:complete
MPAGSRGFKLRDGTRVAAVAFWWYTTTKEALMAERKRSEDGRRETEEYLDGTETPDQAGRAGGETERQVGTRDLQKRAEEDQPGATRVRKSDEKDNS